MKEIVSTKNTWIKELKKLHKKKQRDAESKYLLEGFHLIEEAQKNETILEAVLITKRGQNEWQEWLADFPDEQLYLVSDGVMQVLSDLPTPQGILAVAVMEDEAEICYEGRWLLLDNVQDPGNVGTMIRTADAAGLSGVILGDGTADIYSTKVLRGMQGSNFHLPIVRRALPAVIAQFKERQIPVFGTALDEAAVPFEKMGSRDQFALIMGNEGQGVAKELLAMTDQNLYIPIYGQAESLNVAIAAGILMYGLV